MWLRVLAAFTDNLGSISMQPHGSSQLQFQDIQHGGLLAAMGTKHTWGAHAQSSDADEIKINSLERMVRLRCLQRL